MFAQCLQITEHAVLNLPPYPPPKDEVILEVSESAELLHSMWAVFVMFHNYPIQHIPTHTRSFFCELVVQMLVSHFFSVEQGSLNMSVAILLQQEKKMLNYARHREAVV